MPDDDEHKALLAKAFAGVLATAAALLTVWKGMLPPDRAANLAKFEAAGLRLGLAVVMPEDKWIAQVTWLNPATGETIVADRIEQGGALPSVN